MDSIGYQCLCRFEKGKLLQPECPYHKQQSILLRDALAVLKEAADLCANCGLDRTFHPQIFPDTGRVEKFARKPQVEAVIAAARDAGIEVSDGV